MNFKLLYIFLFISLQYAFSILYSPNINDEKIIQISLNVKDTLIANEISREKFAEGSIYTFQNPIDSLYINLYYEIEYEDEPLWDYVCRPKFSFKKIIPNVAYEIIIYDNECNEIKAVYRYKNNELLYSYWFNYDKVYSFHTIKKPCELKGLYIYKYANNEYINQRNFTVKYYRGNKRILVLSPNHFEPNSEVNLDTVHNFNYKDFADLFIKHCNWDKKYIPYSTPLPNFEIPDTVPFTYVKNFSSSSIIPQTPKIISDELRPHPFEDLPDSFIKNYAFEDTLNNIVTDCFITKLDTIPCADFRMIKYFKYIGEAPIKVYPYSSDPHIICSSPKDTLRKGMIYPIVFCFVKRCGYHINYSGMGIQLSTGEMIRFRFKAEMLDEEKSKSHIAKKKRIDVRGLYKN